MATFQKRKNADGSFTYRAIIRRVKPALSESFATKAAAVAWAGQVESEIIAGTRGEIPNKTFGDLLDRYAREVAPTKRGAKWETVRITLTLRDPIAKVKLADLDSRSVAGWRDRRLAAVSSSSVRREWNQLSAACGIAVREWRWLRANPFSGVRRPVQPQHRNRLATEAELEAIGAAATSPTHKKVVLAARWAIETGMRAGEIVGLTADRVDLEARVAHLEQTKNGTRREVPLSPEAIKIWQEGMAVPETMTLANGSSITFAGGENELWVSENDGPVPRRGAFQMSPAARDVHWRELCKRAGVEGLHFHDLRHNAITQMSKKLDVRELARAVGHKNLNELLTYYNASAADIARKL